MPSPAPHAHQVAVRCVSTGEVMMAWPVDARELVRLDDYEYAPVTPPARDPVPLPNPAESFVESRLRTRAQLEAKSYREIQSIAKKAGMDAKQSASTLIDAIIPHVEGGAISLEVVPEMALPAAQFPGAVVEE